MPDDAPKVPKVDKFTQPGIGIVVLKPGVKPDVVPVVNYPVVKPQEDPDAL